MGCSVQTPFEIADAPRAYPGALGQFLLGQAGCYAVLMEQPAQSCGLSSRRAPILLSVRGRHRNVSHYRSTGVLWPWPPNFMQIVSILRARFVVIAAALAQTRRQGTAALGCRFSKKEQTMMIPAVFGSVSAQQACVQRLI